MAFFKFRKGGDDQAATAQQPESIEVLRKRAKHRLIGAAVLVLVGVIGFPLLVDKQPRPVAVDIPIEIPDKAKVKPLGAVPPAAAPAAAAPAASEAAPPTVALPAPVPQAPEAKAEARPAEETKAEAKPAAKPEPKIEPKAKPDEGARAQSLLDDKPAAAKAGEAKTAEKTDKADKSGRFVVQVGAFAEAPKAREVRLKVERTGLKTYTHVAETKDGQRIRVRVGPFATRAEAEKAAEKIKRLDLPAIILTL